MRLATIGLAGVLVWAAASISVLAQMGTQSLPGSGVRRGAPSPPGSGSHEEVLQRGPSLPPPTYWREKAFPIPFALDGQSGRQLEVLLFVSVDRGANWQLFDRKAASERQFLFHSERDGEYWFASKTVDAQSGVRPALPDRPQLRVIVDTSKPKLELNANVDPGGEVQAAWQVSDMAVVPQSFKLEYQPLDGGAWEQVQVELPDARSPSPRLQGQTAWLPNVSGRTILLRAEVRDAAENRTVVTRRVFLPGGGPQRPPAEEFVRGDSADTGTRDTGPRDTGPRDTGPRDTGGTEGSTPWLAEDPNGPDGADDSYTSTRSGYEAAGVSGAEPLVNGGRDGRHLDSGSFRSGDTEELPEPAQHTYPADDPGYSDAETVPAPEGVPDDLETSRRPRRNEGPQYRAVSGERSPLEPGARRAASGPASDARVARQGRNAPRGEADDESRAEDVDVELPAGESAHLTNTGRFTLEYDVDAVGPAGVERVELWATEDGGRTWSQWGKDPDRRTPFDVEVDREGTYGFRIVIVSANGLASATPRAGEAADIWISLDTTKPVVRLTTVKYGEGAQTGHLVIRWEAADTQLQSRPISLLFAENPDGPWTTIASGLPNSGEYAWPADPNLRGQVYLRIEARDEAGNVGLYQLEDAVNLDGLSPKGRIRGFRPGDRSSRVGPVSPRRR